MFWKFIKFDNNFIDEIYISIKIIMRNIFKKILKFWINIIDISKNINK